MSPQRCERLPEISDFGAREARLACCYRSLPSTESDVPETLPAATH
jgi:hypothetical protein